MCLIPEVDFVLDGDSGLFAYVEKLLRSKGHCVVCTAEGAGQVCKQRLQALQLRYAGVFILVAPAVTRCKCEGSLSRYPFFCSR